MAIELTQDEIDFYHENGYVVARGVYTGEKLEQLRRETDAIIAKAAGVSEHNDVYDVEDSHSPSNPRVRRLKEPYRHFDYFDQVARDPDIVDIVAVGQYGRKPRHLCAIEVIGVRAAVTLEIALIGGLQVPVIHAGERGRAQGIITVRITAVAGATDIGVIVLAPASIAVHRADRLCWWQLGCDEHC